MEKPGQRAIYPNIREKCSLTPIITIQKLQVFKMAWPKRGTRKIVVDGVEYLWHYDAHCIFCSEDVFTVGQAGKPSVLYIDSYVFGEEIRPKNIADSIKWAGSQGWNPESAVSKNMSKKLETDGFYWLPKGIRHWTCTSPESQNV